MEGGRRHTTVRQLELLIEFLEQHKDLALGKVRSKEARAVAAGLWRECANLLNPEGPARTAKEWAKVWNDLKCKVRGKLISNNAELHATGGGSNNSATLTPLEDRVASILGRDIGPLPSVQQNVFASNDGDEIHNADEVVIGEVVVESEPLVQLADAELQNEQQQDQEPAILGIASPTPSLTGRVPSPSSSQTGNRSRGVRQRIRRTAERRRSTTAVPPAQSNRSALEESRAMILNIERTRAEAALLNAQSKKTFADGFKLLAESVDRFSRMYCQQHGQMND